jgi:hypothetical protein
MLAYLSLTTRRLAVLLLLTLLAGCGGSGLTKQEQQQIQNPPTRQIPPEAQALIDQKMREASQKMRQQNPAPGAQPGAPR